MKTFCVSILLTLGSLGIVQAGPIFTQCPPTGLNTGCEFLVSLNPNNTISIAMDPNIPNNGPYGGSDDTLVGVQNNSALTLKSLLVSSSLAIFAFDGDGPCTQTPGPTNCSSDPSGYAGPNISFSNINAAKTAGTVNFNPGLAPGASGYFALEEALQTAQLSVTVGSTVVPEPASIALLSPGLLFLAGLAFRRGRKQAGYSLNG